MTELNRLTETELGTQTPKTTAYEYYAPESFTERLKYDYVAQIGDDRWSQI